MIVDIHDDGQELRIVIKKDSVQLSDTITIGQLVKLSQRISPIINGYALATARVEEAGAWGNKDKVACHGVKNYTHV